MTTIYGIRNCDTMKKAMTWLDAHGADYAFHDYRKLGAPAERLRVWIDRLGWEALLNTRGSTFRRLPAARQTALDGERALELMLEFPSAIRRPVLEHGKTLLVGFDVHDYAVVLGCQ
jgi:arsenate reductase